MSRTLSLRIDFFVTRRCMNACAFCSESELMTGSELSFTQALRQLAEERRRGTAVVQFMGGEPTLHSRFPELVRAAKWMGYTTFLITNGGRFSEPEFCRRTFPWLDEIMFSIHGWDAASHTRVVRNPRAWDGLAAALRHAEASFPGRMIATTTVVGENCASLVKIARFARESGCRELQVVSIIPSGRGGTAFDRLHPAYSEMAPALERLCEYGAAAGLEVGFAGVPLCVLGPWWRLSHDLDENFRVDTGTARDRPLDLWREPGSPKDWAIEIGRVKARRCSGCALRARCGGVYQKYLEARGDAELRPFPAPSAPRSRA